MLKTVCSVLTVLVLILSLAACGARRAAGRARAR